MYGGRLITIPSALTFPPVELDILLSVLVSVSTRQDFGRKQSEKVYCVSLQIVAWLGHMWQMLTLAQKE